MAAASTLEMLQQGLAAFNAGRHAEAQSAFDRVLTVDPQNVDALHLSGLAALRVGRPGDAVTAIGRAVALKPNEPSFRSNLGVALKGAGRAEDAILAFRETIRLAPRYVQAYVNLANTLREKDRRPEAREVYERALAIAPEAPTILNNLGNVQRELGDYDEAIETLRKAVALVPDYVEALNNLGSAETARGRFDDAVVTLKRALALKPDRGMLYVNLGSTYGFLHRYAESEEAYRNAVRLMPDLADAHSGLGDVLLKRGKTQEAVAFLERALELDNELHSARSQLLFVLNYLPEATGVRIAREARTFGDLLPRQVPARMHANAPDPERPLRIGLASGDLRVHSVSQFLLGVLPQLDQSRYELVAYATSVHRDSVTDELRRTIGTWHDVTRLNDQEFAHRVAEDGIDILCDLHGHTMYNRLPVFALRPAPVQMSWLGYSGTTGVDTIDYVLADRHVAPEGDDDQLVETPWRMPDSYLCFTRPTFDAVATSTPAAENGYVTFGSFNNLLKLSDPAVVLWSRILHGVAGSKLLLKAASLDEDETARAIRSRFAEQGIEPDRLILIGRIANQAEHLATYNRIDIGLDSFPYNGTTTTGEALAMGVPVLGLTGERFIAHVGESMLSSAGLPDWIARDADDYVAKAVGFASDIPALDALRGRLRTQVLASPLCDAPRFARNLEDAFRGMWRIWCEGGPGGGA